MRENVLLWDEAVFIFPVDGQYVWPGQEAPVCRPLQ